MKRPVHHRKKFLRLIIFHLYIDVHSCFAVFMPLQYGSGHLGRLHQQPLLTILRNRRMFPMKDYLLHLTLCFCLLFIQFFAGGCVQAHLFPISIRNPCPVILYSFSHGRSVLRYCCFLFSHLGPSFFEMCSLCTYTLFLSESPNLIKDTTSLKQKARQPCLAFCLFSVLTLYSLPLGKGTAHSSYKLIWPVVFDFIIARQIKRDIYA